MAGAIRFRQGLDEETWQPMVGLPHMIQSLGRIWGTRVGTRLNRLEVGADLRSALAEDLTPETALLIYNEMIASAARWEPEAEITSVQLVKVTDAGALGVRHDGVYYPEGRLGNYEIAVPYGSAIFGGRRP